jgi:hypothetical protein
MIENCPECGLPGKMIMYGLPAPELGRAAADGWVGLGGCMIEDGQPDWMCPAGHGWVDRDLDGRERLFDEIMARYDVPDPRPTARVGAGTVEWRDGEHALTIVTAGEPDRVARFEPRTPVERFAFVVSPDERHLALFIDSGQSEDSGRSEHGYELFQVRPAFTHVGGLAATPGQGHPPLFSPDGNWLVTFVPDGWRVRGTGGHFTDLFDKGSDARATLDWASLHVLHVPSGTWHRADVGVEMPVFTYPHEYTEWGTEGAVRFLADDVVELRMPWGVAVAVPLPPSAVITTDRSERPPGNP